MNASRGGRRTAERMDAESKTARGEAGGSATLQRYGSDFYSYITKFRKRSGPRRRLHTNQ